MGIPPLWIAAFVVFDALVMFLVLRAVMRKRGASLPGIDLAGLREFTAEIEATSEMHLRTNWSGDVDTLPTVLEALIAQLQSRADERGYPFERELLKRSVSLVLERKQIVSADELRSAMKRVA